MTRSTLRGAASRTLHPSLLLLKSGFLENARSELQSKKIQFGADDPRGAPARVRRLVCPRAHAALFE